MNSEEEGDFKQDLANAGKKHLPKRDSLNNARTKPNLNLNKINSMASVYLGTNTNKT